MRDIDTKLLRSFLAVATEKSFSTAAERLECSQGTMSVRIQLLEEQVGDRLFDRGRHNVKITAAGQDLLPHAQALVDMHDRLIDRAAARRVSGRVRLGVGEDCQSALNIDPLSACNIDPLIGTAEVVPVVHRGDPRGFV